MYYPLFTVTFHWTKVPGHLVKYLVESSIGLCTDLSVKAHIM